jgi:hypothetical protein
VGCCGVRCVVGGEKIDQTLFTLPAATRDTTLPPSLPPSLTLSLPSPTLLRPIHSLHPLSPSTDLKTPDFIDQQPRDHGGGGSAIGVEKRLHGQPVRTEG